MGEKEKGCLHFISRRSDGRGEKGGGGGGAAKKAKKDRVGGGRSFSFLCFSVVVCGREGEKKGGGETGKFLLIKQRFR